MTRDPFEHVPATHNLQAFLRTETNVYGDGVDELLSFARTTLESMEAVMTEIEFSMRSDSLLDAEDAWILDQDIDSVRKALQHAFRDWPASPEQPA